MNSWFMKKVLKYQEDAWTEKIAEWFCRDEFAYSSSYLTALKESQIKKNLWYWKNKRVKFDEKDNS